MVNSEQNLYYRLLTLDYLFACDFFDPYCQRLAITYKKYLQLVIA